MIGVEELRRVDVGADILDHHVGRVTPAADGNVAIRLRESLEGGAIGASHDLDAGPRGERESAGVERLLPREVRPQQRSEAGPPGGGTILEAEAIAGACADIEAERCGASRLSAK